jgi:hypothetical protein
MAAACVNDFPKDEQRFGMPGLQLATTVRADYVAGSAKMNLGANVDGGNQRS